MNEIWFKHSKIVNITKYLKLWWNDEYQRKLEKYRLSRHLKDWKTFKSIVNKTKQEFFNTEIAGKNSGSWKLMNQVKKRKLLAIETIKYNRQPCLELGNLWQALVRCSLYLKVKICEVGLDMHRVQKLHAISSVMWTCQNNLDLNLYIVPPTSCVVAISEDGLVKSYKERNKVHCH